MNRRFALFKLLLATSLLSGLSVSLIAVALLGFDAWKYINNHQVSYSYLVGPNSFGEFVGQGVAPSLSSWTGLILGNQLTYYVFLCAFAAAVGLAVFTLLQASGVLIHGSVELLQATLDRQPGRRSARLELFLRFGLRCLAVAGWAIYIVVFLSALMPGNIITGRLALEALQAGNYLGTLGLYLAALGLVTIELHLHVVFMRLVALRPRLFGGTNEIIEAEG